MTTIGGRMSIKEFKEMEMAKAMLHQMAKLNDLEYMVDEVSPETMERVARKTHNIAVALEEYDMEQQRNYLFTIVCLLMLTVESLNDTVDELK